MSGTSHTPVTSRKGGSAIRGVVLASAALITVSIAALAQISFDRRESPTASPSSLAGVHPSPSLTDVPRRISLTGSDLTINDIVAISEGQATIAMSDEGMDRVRAARAVVDHYVEAKLPAYGITTMYGADFKTTLPPDEMERFGRINIIQEATRVGNGSLPIVDAGVMRAAWAMLANSFARGFSGASPELTQTLIDRVNANQVPTEVEYGNSMGDADLIANAQASLILLQDPTFVLRAGEATNLLTHNFIAVAYAALETKRTERLLQREMAALALTIEGFRANLGPLSELPYAVDAGGSRTAVRAGLRHLLEGSALWNDGSARQIQDFLSLRDGAENLATLRHTLDVFVPVLEGFANSNQGSPIVDVKSQRLISVPDFDTSQVTLGMDALRQAVGLTVIASNSRGLKLMSKPFIDLPSGLVAGDPNAFDGLYTRNIGYLMTSLERSALTETDPVLKLTESYMAEGDEDYSPAFPHSVGSMGSLLDDAEKVVALEALIGSFALEQRLRSAELRAGDVPPNLRELQQNLIARSPMTVAVDEQYDLKGLVHYFLDEYHS